MIKKYNNYKDSGVEWLGKIPEHWECTRMKRLFRDHSEKNHPQAELLSVTQNQGVVPRAWVENRMVMPSGALEAFKLIKKGDFAISLRSFEGGLEYCHYTGIISPAYTVLKRNRSDLYEHYYKYLFKSFSFISELQTSVVGIREGKNISYPELSYSFLPVPSEKEQTAIANFLDDKTEKIDQAVRIKEQQIALLKERKQILIHKAVTRGLDDSVPLKDSGVEWIGEIPEHWEVKPLKYLTRYFKGFAFSSIDFSEKGIPIVKASNIKNETIENVSSFIALNNQKARFENFKLAEGDIIISTVGSKPEIKESAVGQLAIIQNAFSGSYLNQNTVCIRTASDLIYKSFLKDTFVSNYMRSNFDRISLWIANQAYIEVKSILEIFIALPPLSEQKEIANYIETASQKIETAISLKQQEIEKLQEYKRSLINSVVTGKVKII